MSDRFIYKEEFLYPIDAFLILTNDCNLACKYCFVEQHPEYMSFDIAKKTVDFLAKNLLYRKNKKIICENAKAGLLFFGGEPLLQYNNIIVPIINYINETYPNMFTYNMTTNGTLLTLEKLKFLKKNQVQILHSIDGDKQTQDYNRPCKNINLSSSELIEKNIPNILKEYPEICFRSTVIPATVSFLFDNYLYAEKKGYKSYFVMPNNREQWNKEDIEELNIQLNKIFYYRIQQYKNKIMPIEFSSIDNIFTAIYKYQIFNNDISEIKNNNKCNIARCGLGISGVAVDFKGYLYGCQEQPSKKEKNIFLIGNLDNGIDQQKHEQLLLTYYNSPMNQCHNKELCNNCIQQIACYKDDKICHSTSYDLFKNFYEKAEIQCLWEQMLVKNVLISSYILLSINNSTFKQYLKNLLQ